MSTRLVNMIQHLFVMIQQLHNQCFTRIFISILIKCISIPDLFLSSKLVKPQCFKQIRGHHLVVAFVIADTCILHTDTGSFISTSQSKRIFFHETISYSLSFIFNYSSLNLPQWPYFSHHVKFSCLLNVKAISFIFQESSINLYY